MTQRDQQPQVGFYPTFTWREGEIIRGVYSVPLPPPGTEIRVGLHDPTTTQRLSRTDTGADQVTVKP